MTTHQTMVDQHEEEIEACDCDLPNCKTCHKRRMEEIDQKHADDDALLVHEEDERLERLETYREEYGDDDDCDEEDLHGSHPIDEPSNIEE